MTQFRGGAEVTYRLDGWQEIDKISEYELRHKLEQAYEYLAYDLKVCGAGYPSPQKDRIKAIILELGRRGR